MSFLASSSLFPIQERLKDLAFTCHSRLKVRFLFAISFTKQINNDITMRLIQDSMCCMQQAIDGKIKSSNALLQTPASAVGL